MLRYENENECVALDAPSHSRFSIAIDNGHQDSHRVFDNDEEGMRIKVALRVTFELWMLSHSPSLSLTLSSFSFQFLHKHIFILCWFVYSFIAFSIFFFSFLWSMWFGYVLAVCSFSPLTFDLFSGILRVSESLAVLYQTIATKHTKKTTLIGKYNAIPKPPALHFRFLLIFQHFVRFHRCCCYCFWWGFSFFPPFFLVDFFFALFQLPNRRCYLAWLSLSLML